jgi:GGDEF domain-containing protein
MAFLVGSAVVFLAIVPFAKMQLAPRPGFIAIYETALVITAVFLFGQFAILQSRALLLLASGYLFTASLAVAHALSFPDLFSPSGLLGGGPQTTAWLYMFWHAGFALLVIAYARCGARAGKAEPRRNHSRFDAPVGVAAVLVAACALTLIATWGHDVLPETMQGNRYTSAMTVVQASIWIVNFGALVVLWRRRPHSVLDLWLMVVMCAWVFDITLSAILNAGRFDVGFYAGRVYGLLASSFVLAMLILENSMLYVRLIRAHESERQKAAELAALDPLTGIANRRSFEEALDQEWRRTRRHRTPLCLLMIDVDEFKRFNDAYDHVAGDQCLRAIARVLAGNARRAGQMAARYGGEEFAVLLPHVHVDEAHRLAQRICEDVPQGLHGGEPRHHQRRGGERPARVRLGTRIHVAVPCKHRGWGTRLGIRPSMRPRMQAAIGCAWHPPMARFVRARRRPPHKHRDAVLAGVRKSAQKRPWPECKW